MAKSTLVRWYRPRSVETTFSSRRERSELEKFAPDAIVNWKDKQSKSLTEQRNLLLDPANGTGIPVVENAESAKEYAIGLLRLAAEIEHALMVQYLYAADSIDPDDDPDRNRRKLQKIAVEEMGHLGTVQNLLLLLGGPSAFHMQRDEVRHNSDLNPIPFVLEPVSLESLAKYTTAEAPADVPIEKKPLIDRLRKIAENEIGFEPRRVGAVYAMLRWLFMDKMDALQWMDLKTIVPDAPLPNNPHLTDADLQHHTVIGEYEILGLEWGDNSDDFILESARTRKQAVDAIISVAEQGEGFDGSDDAHFDEFVELVEAYEKSAFGRPVAISPTMEPDHGGENGIEITAVYTRLWAEIQSLQYTLLCIGLLHGFSTPRPHTGSNNTRKLLAEQTIRAMKTILQSTSLMLCEMPLKDGQDQLCGAPYNLDPQRLVSTTNQDYAARQISILDELSLVYANVEKSPEYDEFSAQADLLRELRQKDRDRRRLLEPIVDTPVTS